VLTKVKATTLQGQVYDQIKAAIIGGYFSPGEQITIRQLAQELGTSAMPVREAITRLISEQALESDGSRSIRVPSLSREKFEDIVLVRSLIEPQAMALATANLSDAILLKLRTCNDQLLRAIDAGELQVMLETNRLFHFTVYEAAASPLLMQVIDSLWLRSGPYLHALFSRSKALQEQVGTERINLELLEALSARDAGLARSILERDIRQSAAWFSRHFADPAPTSAA